MNDTGIASSVATGDDAQYGRDSIAKTNSDIDGHKGFSFTKLDSSGNPTTGIAACIRDNVTGLTWSTDQDKTNWDGIASIINSANSANSSSGLCNKKNWVLPTLKELLTIVSYHRTAPAIDTGVFSDIPAPEPPPSATEIYWTDSHNAATPLPPDVYSMQWVVNFQFGKADNTGLTDSAFFRVRLVSHP